LEKQAKLVLSENEVLMERQELQNKKLEEVTAFYKGEGICNMRVVGVVLKFISTGWCNPLGDLAVSTTVAFTAPMWLSFCIYGLSGIVKVCVSNAFLLTFGNIMPL
jgi:hypothetical protein